MSGVTADNTETAPVLSVGLAVIALTGVIGSFLPEATLTDIKESVAQFAGSDTSQTAAETVVENKPAEGVATASAEAPAAVMANDEQQPVVASENAAVLEEAANAVAEQEVAEASTDQPKEEPTQAALSTDQAKTAETSASANKPAVAAEPAAKPDVEVVSRESTVPSAAPSQPMAPNRYPSPYAQPYSPWRAAPQQGWQPQPAYPPVPYNPYSPWATAPQR